MSWVIQTIVKILLGACVDVFVAFSDDFISAFGINIGADFPSVASEAKGNSPSLAKILSEYPNDNGLSSVFDNFFPLGSYKVLFVSMALVHFPVKEMLPSFCSVRCRSWIWEKFSAAPSRIFK